MAGCGKSPTMRLNDIKIDNDKLTISDKSVGGNLFMTNIYLPSNKSNFHSNEQLSSVPMLFNVYTEWSNYIEEALISTKLISNRPNKDIIVKVHVQNYPGKVLDGAVIDGYRYKSLSFKESMGHLFKTHAIYTVIDKESKTELYKIPVYSEGADNTFSGGVRYNMSIKKSILRNVEIFVTKLAEALNQ